MRERNLLAAQLRAAIAKSGMTPYQIAKAAKIEPDSLYRFMSASRDLRFATAGKIADVLNLELKPRTK